MIITTLAVEWFSGSPDEVAPEARCIDAFAEECTEPSRDVYAKYSDSGCNQTQAHVCIVPIGLVSLDLIERLKLVVEQETTGTVVVASPMWLWQDDYNPVRRQFDVRALALKMRDRHFGGYLPKGTLVLGVTNVDLYDSGTEEWRFTFGLRTTLAAGNVMAIISNHRFHTSSAELSLERTLKMARKYVGIHFLGMEPSMDPSSALYDHIRSVRDLDRMSENLPVE